jgi:hypothetical protein
MTLPSDRLVLPSHLPFAPTPTLPPSSVINTIACVPCLYGYAQLVFGCVPTHLRPFAYTPRCHPHGPSTTRQPPTFHPRAPPSPPPQSPPDRVPSNDLYQPYMPMLAKLFILSSAVHQLCFSLCSTLPYAVGQVRTYVRGWVGGWMGR